MKTKKKKPAKQKVNELFFTTYIGEYVQVIAKTHKEMGIPVVIEGFLLDIDENFYYFSDDGQSVVRSLKTEDLSIIEIVKVETEFDRILTATPMPGRKEDGN